MALAPAEKGGIIEGQIGSSPDVSYAYDYQYIYKVGNVVYLSFGLTGVTGQAWKSIMWLPIGFRPKVGLSVVALTGYASFQELRIFPNGSVQSPVTMTNQALRLSATWIAD